jgi:hypothetical protein
MIKSWSRTRNWMHLVFPCMLNFHQCVLETRGVHDLCMWLGGTTAVGPSIPNTMIPSGKIYAEYNAYVL